MRTVWSKIYGLQAFCGFTHGPPVQCPANTERIVSKIQCPIGTLQNTVNSFRFAVWSEVSVVTVCIQLCSAVYCTQHDTVCSTQYSVHNTSWTIQYGVQYWVQCVVNWMVGSTVYITYYSVQKNSIVHITQYMVQYTEECTLHAIVCSTQYSVQPSSVQGWEGLYM